MKRDPRELLERALAKAKALGATSADALFVAGRSAEAKVRLGEVEAIKQSRSNGLGVRVFVGDRSASTSTSEMSDAALDTLIARTVQAARVMAADPVSGLPEASLFERAPVGDLDLFDPAIDGLDAEGATLMAKAAEDAARGADPRITNSEGAEVSWGDSEVHLANSLGVYRSIRKSSASLWTMPLAATESGGMERDYWYTSARHLSQLDSPESVGREAARRTLRRLGARKPDTAKVPVIFEWTVASRLLSALGGAINGNAIYRNASYLIGKVGEQIAAPNISIVDDACVPRGPGSKPWDGEGLATGRTSVVEDGVLKSYLLDCYSARKLGLTTTRSASRGLGGSPGPSATNLWMSQGDQTLEAIIANTPRGLLVTELIGFGVNTITGDYSQGAVGHWIEDGAIAYPVHELTIASTLPTIWSSIDALANDRDPRRAVSAPSFRVAEMTVAGA